MAAVVVDTVTTDNYSCWHDQLHLHAKTTTRLLRSKTTVKQFEMQASIAASPTEVNSGDEVTVALRDFPGFDSDSVEVTLVSLAGDRRYGTSLPIPPTLLMTSM